jgi:SPP1 family phage portal protein
MEQLEFDALLSTPEDLIKEIKASKGSIDLSTYQKQYDPKKHDVTDNTKRPDKLVDTDTGIDTVPVARIPVPLQKKIVLLAAAFLCGNPIELVANPEGDKEEGLLAVLKRSWKDNKLDYKAKKLAKLMMSETEVAELWYIEKIDPGYWKGTVNDISKVTTRLRMKILANKYGDELFPVYSNSGDMIAFARGYALKKGSGKEEHFDIYTATKTIKLTKTETGWIPTIESNPVGKIPVVYYNQEAPEWFDVQEMIDRFEKVISNHGDTNDYFVSPMVFVEGEVEGFSKKGEQGKVLIGKGGAKAQYLTWDQSPESLKLEYNNLRSLVMDMTDTPDISIEQMKALGTYSGIALKMLFLGPHLKASDKEENFGESVQRRINYMKAALGGAINVALAEAVPMLIEPKFEFFLPKNIQEIIEILSTATGGKQTMSVKTAVAANPLVTDPAKELEAIQQEASDESITL